MSNFVVIRAGAGLRGEEHRDGEVQPLDLHPEALFEWLQIMPDLEGDIAWLADEAPSLEGRAVRVLEHRLELGLRRLSMALCEMPTSFGTMGSRTDVVVDATSPAWDTFPWELLCGASDGDAPVRVVRSHAGPGSLHRWLDVEEPRPPGPLRVLFVSARPAGDADISPLAVTAGIVDRRLAGEMESVVFEVLRPATFKALDDRLQEALRDGAPFHVVHLDVHGSSGGDLPGGDGTLAFERPVGGDAWKSGREVGAVLVRGGVGTVVTNACRSARAGAAASTVNHVAAQLIEAGVEAVVAMAYLVYPDVAAAAAASMYEALAGGASITESVERVRARLRAMWPTRRLTATVLPRVYLGNHGRIGDRAVAGAVTSAPVLTDVVAPTVEGASIAEDAALIGQIDGVIARRGACLLTGMRGMGAPEVAHRFGSWWMATWMPIGRAGHARVVEIDAAGLDRQAVELRVEQARAAHQGSRLLVVVQEVRDHSEFSSLVDVFHVGEFCSLLATCWRFDGVAATKDDRVLTSCVAAPPVDRAVGRLLSGVDVDAFGVVLVHGLVDRNLDVLQWLEHECTLATANGLGPLMDQIIGARWGWERAGLPVPLAVQEVVQDLSEAEARHLTTIGARLLVLHQSAWTTVSSDIVQQLIVDRPRLGGVLIDGQALQAQIADAVRVLEARGLAMRSDRSNVRLHPFAPFLVMAAIKTDLPEMDGTSFGLEQAAIETLVATLASAEHGFERAVLSTFGGAPTPQYGGLLLVGLFASLRAGATSAALDQVFEIWASSPLDRVPGARTGFARWLRVLFGSQFEQLGPDEMEHRGVLHQVWADEARRAGDVAEERALRHRRWRILHGEVQRTVADAGIEVLGHEESLFLWSTYCSATRDLTRVSEPSDAIEVARPALDLAQRISDRSRTVSLGFCVVQALRQLGQLREACDLGRQLLAGDEGDAIRPASLAALAIATANCLIDLDVLPVAPHPPAEAVREARRLYLRGIRSAQEPGDSFAGLVGLGCLEGAADNSERALEYFLAASTLRSAEGGSLRELDMNIVHALERLGRDDLAAQVLADLDATERAVVE